jgi:DNA-binding NarL/FixJ family response regulator
MIRIHIVEDHPVMRETLRDFLERDPEIEVSGESATAATALAAIAKERPDLVVIDVALPGTSGIELARSLRERHPDLPLAMLSGHGGKAHVQQALEAGAVGYILKGNATEIYGAIRQILHGERYLSPGLEP